MNLDNVFGVDGWKFVTNVRFEVVCVRTLYIEFGHEFRVKFEGVGVSDKSLSDLSGIIHSPSGNSFDMYEMFARHKVKAHNSDFDFEFFWRNVGRCRRWRNEWIFLLH